MGINTYKKTCKLLYSKYGKNLNYGGMQKKFSDFISRLDSTNINYIMRNIRYNVLCETSPIFKSDLNFIDSYYFDPEKVIIGDYPSEEEVLNDIRKFLDNLAFRSNKSMYNDLSTDMSDFKSEFTISAFLSYRKYIFNYFQRENNEENYKMLLGSIHKSVKNKRIDYMYSFFKDKRISCLKTVQLDTLTY